MGPTCRDATPGFASVALALCDTGDEMTATFHIVKQLISVDCLCENQHGELVTVYEWSPINRRSAVALEYRRTIDAPDVVRLWVDRVSINGSERRVTIVAIDRHCTLDRTAVVRAYMTIKRNARLGQRGITEWPRPDPVQRHGTVRFPPSSRCRRRRGQPLPSAGFPTPGLLHQYRSR